MVDYLKIQFIKNFEKKRVSKSSNGLGFFVLTYFIMMVVLQIFVEILYSPKTTLNGTNMNALYFQLIFSSVGSAFLAGLFYLLLSKNKLAVTIKTEKVKTHILFTFIFIGMAIAMVANYAASIVDSNLSVFGLENNASTSIPANSVSEIILYIIAVAIVPAFAEEFAFRGIFMGVLRKHGDSFAIIASSIVFGAMHGNITQIVFAFILGLIFGYIDCKTNSIMPSIVVHFINNFYAVLLDVLSTTGIDDRIYLSIYYFLVILFCLLGVLSFIYLLKTEKNIFKFKEAKSILTLKEKFGAFFSSPGIILITVVFSIETVLCIGVL